MTPPDIPLLLSVVDAVGTFAFALSGATLAIRKRFDIFGVLFLAFVVAVAGGVARDVLIGAVPPAAVATIDGGSRANEQLDPNCVIENVCPSMVFFSSV